MILEIRGGTVIVDEEDVDILKTKRWWVSKHGYAQTTSAENPRKNIGMHAFLMGHIPGMEVDHINQNKLDNRRENLRFATRTQNSANRGKNKSVIPASSRFKGVCFDKNRGKWLAGIKANYKRINTGRFDTEEEAALYRDLVAMAIQGEFAVLNHPYGTPE